jgi:hypothetical protein
VRAQRFDPGAVLSRSLDSSIELTEDLGNLLPLIVLSIIPIAGSAALGYFAEVVRRNPVLFSIFNFFQLNLFD